ncbi:MAG: DUF4926 domain-containing protein [Caldilineaceae bacterium]
MKMNVDILGIVMNGDTKLSTVWGQKCLSTLSNYLHDELKLLDVVALTEDLPEEGLQRGQVGTIVEELAPDVYEVEFSDNWGRAYAMLALRVEQLLLLRYELALAA